MFQALCANVALNSRANVFTHHSAAGAEAGILRVPPLDPAGAHNYGGLSLSGVGHGEAVPVVTIDGLDLAACHLIKLDVEGMESEALRGAAATIARCRPILYVENDREARSAELISLIQSFGYRLYWHLPPLYRGNNYRADPENIFGNTISVNMLCLPAESTAGGADRAARSRRARRPLALIRRGRARWRGLPKRCWLPKRYRLVRWHEVAIGGGLPKRGRLYG